MPSRTSAGVRKYVEKFIVHHNLISRYQGASKVPWSHAESMANNHHFTYLKEKCEKKLPLLQPMNRNTHSQYFQVQLFLHDSTAFYKALQFRANL